jgi:hypothetical protein
MQQEDRISDNNSKLLFYFHYVQPDIGRSFYPHKVPQKMTDGKEGTRICFGVSYLLVTVNLLKIASYT